MSRLIADNTESIGTNLVATHIDSWENGSQNWTDGMREEFLYRRKYDLLKFLPVFAGQVVENAEYTDRFLWDFRRTVSELIIENYAGRMRELANQNGLRFTVEAYGAPCDFMQYAGMADEPMGEFWIGNPSMNSCRGMASAGHIYGKPIIGAEAFTAQDSERGLMHPGAIKTLADKAFCEGINRLVFHRYSFQPWENVRPGMMMGPWGIHYERTQTWWELTPQWHKYLSRCQYMLQQGEYVADILYLETENSPQRYFYEHPRSGYQWDNGNTDVLLRAEVDNGTIVLESGMRYRLFALPPANRMTVQLLEKTLQLIEDGATVIGNQIPTAAPNLTDYPNNDSRVNELAQKIWGDVRTPTGENTIGKGRIVWGTTAESVLAEMGVVKVFEANAPLNWHHRRLPDAEIFFIANPQEGAILATVQLRGVGNPEIMYPETGKTVQVNSFFSDLQTTKLLLPLGATESVFIVLRQSQTGELPNNNGNTIVRMTKDGHQLIDLTTPVGNITIKSAKYGAIDDPSLTIDVEPLLTKLVGAGERQFAVNRIRQLTSNPAPQSVRTLIIEYEIDGKQYLVKGRDGETVFLDAMLPPVKILNATYGLPGAEENIQGLTENIQRLFDRGENNFRNERLVPPVPLSDGTIITQLEAKKPKTLTFTYELNGKQATWKGNDLKFVYPGSENFFVPITPHYDIDGKYCIDFHESGKYELEFASRKKRTVKVSLPEPLNLDSDWDVAFPHKTVRFNKLISWCESEDDSIKFFSGAATYTKTFTVPKYFLKKGTRIILDLGQVEIIAQIELNGVSLGNFWKVDKSIDITDYLKKGDNHLQISVTNLWANRLIGDAHLPASDERNENGSLRAWPQWLLDENPDPNGRSTFAMWNLWRANDDPVPSGLIGPVRLLPVKRIIFKIP